MNPLIYLGILVGVPLALTLVFRVSAVFLFLSVVAGNLLAVHLTDDASLAASMVIRGQHTALITKFALLLLPVALTILFMRKTIPGHKLPLHVLPLAGVSVSLGVLVLPLLDGSLQQKIFEAPYGAMLRNSQDVVLGATAVAVLLLMWLTESKPFGKHKKH